MDSRWGSVYPIEKTHPNMDFPLDQRSHPSSDRCWYLQRDPHCIPGQVLFEVQRTLAKYACLTLSYDAITTRKSSVEPEV